MTQTLQIVPDRCTGCMQCELACSWVQTGTFQPARSLIRVNIFDEEASYAPYTCLQCEEAWCLNVCPVNAIGIDEVTGAKLIIEPLCIGCHLCTIACPFRHALDAAGRGHCDKMPPLRRSSRVRRGLPYAGDRICRSIGGRDVAGDRGASKVHQRFVEATQP